MSDGSFLATLPRRFRYLLGFLYQSQLKMEFPMAVLEHEGQNLPPVPTGYLVRSPEGASDVAAWAALLNEDGGFGRWDAERVQSEILDHLISPDAATLVFHEGRLVGCGSTCDTSSRGRKTGLGMFLYLRSEHRAKGKLASLITFRTLACFPRDGYEKATLTTDPTRLAALVLYLARGAKPVRDSLWSWVQWHRVFRRLKPTLEAVARKRARARLPEQRERS